MLRLFSILLLLAGLGAAGYAGSIMLEDYAPHGEVMAASPDGEMATEQAFEESAPFEAAPVEAMEAPAPTEAFEMAEAPLPEGEFLDEPMAEASDDAAGAGPSRTMMPGITGDVFAESAGSAPALDVPPTSRSVNLQPSSSESFIETLKTVPVAHETPTSAEYKRAFDVTLAIDSTGDATAADALPGRGNVIESEALVSERVEARLSGANFDIVPMSPETQTLSPLTENVWRWSVRPLSAGNHDLVFEIYAIDEDAVVPLRTFRDTVTVSVSGINRAIAFADQANPLFVLLGGLGSAIAGLIGVIRFFGRN